MHIIEKFKREGDAIFYDLTLEDPGLIGERGNCETSFETDAAATQIRH